MTRMRGTAKRLARGSAPPSLSSESSLLSESRHVTVGYAPPATGGPGAGRPPCDRRRPSWRRRRRRPGRYARVEERERVCVCEWRLGGHDQPVGPGPLQQRRLRLRLAAPRARAGDTERARGGVPRTPVLVPHGRAGAQRRFPCIGAPGAHAPTWRLSSSLDPTLC